MERTIRSVEQTPAGETFMANARRIISHADEGLSAVTAFEISVPLRIGFPENLLPQHLHLLLSQFKRIQPKAQIEICLGSGFDLRRSLDQHQLDVVVTGPEGEGGEVLLAEPLVWVGPKAGEPEMRENPVGLFLMQPPCSYQQAAFDALTAAGMAWHVKVSANSIQTVQSAVAVGLSVSAVAQSAVNPQLKIINQRFPTLAKTSINTYWNATNPHPQTKRFMAFIKEALRSISRNMS